MNNVASKTADADICSFSLRFPIFMHLACRRIILLNVGSRPSTTAYAYIQTIYRPSS